MEDTYCTICHRSSIHICIYAVTSCFTTNEAYTFIRNEVIEHPHRIGAATNTGHNSCWQLTFRFENLFTRFTADDGLEIANNHREWMRAHNGAQHIVCIGHTICPFAHSFGYSIFQCASTCCYRMYLCAQQFHAIYVERLAFTVLSTHEYFAFHAHQCGYRCCCYTVLTSPSFSDYACFTHSFCQQHLANYVIQFVRTSMV